MEVKPKPIFGDDQILIIGTVKDVAKRLASNVMSLDKALASYQKRWFLVESNSQDETLSVLESLSQQIANFDFLSLGHSGESRLAAIARARHVCQEWVIDQDPQIARVLVVDFDQKYSWGDVQFQTSLTKYDAIFCHQNPYYDTYAYMDIAGSISLPRGLMGMGCLSRLLNYLWFSPRLQLELGTITTPIRVRSAFGGMAVYTRQAFQSGSYLGRYVDEGTSERLCEHVVFNQSLAPEFGAIYIDPNFSVPVHNEHYKIARLLKFLTRKRS